MDTSYNGHFHLSPCKVAVIESLHCTVNSPLTDTLLSGQLYSQTLSSITLSAFFPSPSSYKNNCRKRTALLPVPEVSAFERVDCVWFATKIKKVLLWSIIDPKTSLIIFLYVFFIKVQRRFLVRLPDFFVRIIDKDGVHDVSIPSKSWEIK